MSRKFPEQEHQMVLTSTASVTANKRPGCHGAWASHLLLTGDAFLRPFFAFSGVKLLSCLSGSGPATSQIPEGDKTPNSGNAPTSWPRQSRGESAGRPQGRARGTLGTRGAPALLTRKGWREVTPASLATERAWVFLTLAGCLPGCRCRLAITAGSRRALRSSSLCPSEASASETRTCSAPKIIWR